MSTTTLPEKWAVEITSLEDAERLQRLFPKEVSSKGRTIVEMYKTFAAKNTPFLMSKSTDWIGSWQYSYNKGGLEVNGYTIYTITELEDLKSQE